VVLGGSSAAPAACGSTACDAWDQAGAARKSEGTTSALVVSNFEILITSILPLTAGPARLPPSAGGEMPFSIALPAAGYLSGFCGITPSAQSSTKN
jgi:hypothetical protein